MSPSEAIEALAKELDEYAVSFRKLSCEAYLVEKLSFGGASDNVKLAYGRTQGIELAAERIRASRALAALNEVASAQIAGKGWRTMESAPVCEAILATCRVKNMEGDQWWETYRIVIDDSTGEIDTDIDQPWSLEDYEFWQPLPAPPATAAP